MISEYLQGLQILPPYMNAQSGLASKVWRFFSSFFEKKNCEKTWIEKSSKVANHPITKSLERLD